MTINKLFGATNSDMFKMYRGKETLYDSLLPTDNCIEYNPKTLLEEGQCYCVESFSSREYGSPTLQKMLVNLKNNKLDSARYPEFQGSNFDEIKYLVYNHSSNLYFEAITPSKIIKKKWFTISRDVAIQDEPLLVAKDQADAMYDAKKDKLFFLKLDRIKKIFSGIEELYREATKKELQKFVNCSSFRFSASFKISKIGIQNRKKIAQVFEKFENMDVKKLDQYQAYASEFEIGIEDNKFVIDNETDLKNLLYVLDERYYETSIEKEKRVANSIQPVSQNK